MCELATVNAFHDSLNFIIPPSSRQCFFEDFGASTPVKTIDTFVQSGGKANMKLQARIFRLRCALVLLTMFLFLDLWAFELRASSNGIYIRHLNVGRNKYSVSMCLQESFGGIPYVEETIDTSTMQLAETDSFLYDFQPSLAGFEMLPLKSIHIIYFFISLFLGTYAVCLDNTLAHMLPKLVQVMYCQ